MRGLRYVVLAVLALSLVAAGPRGVALANDGGSGSRPDLGLAALRETADAFRGQIAAVRESCDGLRWGTADADVSDCESALAALHDEFQALRRQALEVSRRAELWLADQRAQLGTEEQKQDQQRQERQDASAKAPRERLRWLDEHLVAERVDLGLYRERAQAARESAGDLEGVARAELLAVADEWDAKAAALAATVKQHEAERAQLVASIEATRKQQPPASKKTPAPAKDTTSTQRDALLGQLKRLDDMIAYKRSKIAEFQANGDQDGVVEYTRYLDDYLAQRTDVLAKLARIPNALSSYRADLSKALRSLDDLAAYKRQKIAEARAAADQDGVQRWTDLLNEVLRQRADIQAKLDGLPTT